MPHEKQHESSAATVPPIEMSPDQKVSALCSMLSERYTAEHSMRERSTTFTVWVLGLGVALLWAVLTQTQLTGAQRVVALMFSVTYSGLSLWFLAQIHRGFNANRRLVVRIETLLGFHVDGFYGDGPSILPRVYQKPPASHFWSLYLLVAALLAFLAAAFVMNPVGVHPHTPPADVRMAPQPK